MNPNDFVRTGLDLSATAAAERRAALWAAHRRRAWADVTALFARADGAIMAFVDRNILPFCAGALAFFALLCLTL